uniref:EF-hand domain-containing protein n=1 Tax=Panagrolaimus davidi TaxID=227884 RepID=A0A914QZ50_9BILA
MRKNLRKSVPRNAKCCGTFGPWGHCCDYASCNIFCCNCDGDCTANCHRKIVRSAFTPQNGTEKFATIDTNNDNFIDFNEAFKYALKHGGNATELKSDQTWFKKIDENSDGLIIFHEFDA